MRSYLCLGILFCCLAAALSSASAQETQPYDFYADAMGYDPASGMYTARGNVRIEGEGVIITADQVSYAPDQGIIHGEGSIVMRMGEDRMEGDRLVYHLEEQRGFFENGRLFISESQFRVRGRRIERTGERTYVVDDAGLTTCEGERPDWEITASRISLTLEGYGTLNHGAFRIRGLPALYTPWLFFPAKTKRQSGLLLPEIHLSDRHGYEQLQPLYLALSDSSDATLYYHFMGKGPDRLGLEYRKLWSSEDRLTLRLDGLKDENPTQTAVQEGVSRDRYWFRMKQNLAFAEGVQGFMDLDLLSDIRYMDDFKGGTLGFTKTNALFQKEFGRELDPEKEDTRTNRLLLTKTGEVFRMEGEVIWEDAVRRRTQDLQDDTVQRLPRLSLSTRRQRLLDLPLYHVFEGESVYFHRIDGERGTRLDLAPRVYAPFRLGPISAEPSLGLRQTFWHSENPLEETSSGYHTENRLLYDARMDLFTEVYRVFDGGPTGADKIRHSLQPRLTFEYVPDKDQNHLPFFDDLDRIEKKRRLTYSLTQTLTARFKEERPGEEGPQDAYRDYMRFKISQDYDMDRAEARGEKPFSDPKAELSLWPLPYVRLFGDITWSTQEAKWSSYSSGAEVSRDAHYFYAEHRYASEVSASLHLRGYLALREDLGLLWDYERNLKEKIIQKQDYGLRYNAGCWQLDLIYSDDKDDRKIGFYWTLTGLGVLEHSLDESFLP